MWSVINFKKDFSVQKDPGVKKTEHCLCVLFFWFWYFPIAKIPNSGIGAGLGSLKVTKKLKGGVFWLQQSVVFKYTVKDLEA